MNKLPIIDGGGASRIIADKIRRAGAKASRKRRRMKLMNIIGEIEEMPRSFDNK